MRGLGPFSNHNWRIGTHAEPAASAPCNPGDERNIYKHIWLKPACLARSPWQAAVSFPITNS